MLSAGLPRASRQADVREMRLRVAEFDAAIYLYGQSEVARPEDLREILARIRRALRPGAPLAMEIRAAATVPQSTTTAWFTGADDLFGPGAHLVLMERGWDAEARPSVDRHHVLAAETGEISVIGTTSRAFEPDEIGSILAAAGFPHVELHPGPGGPEFKESANWVVAIGR
jgi:hypothetical protein